ncbi:hemin-degrading factor [Sinimarinibacterium sp. NLF-5-8]|uniref:hemin-degrading factor n=1 Tax=Sinimarinibacterium sp. NLF-5-8 TaxID=2698684 RepID=UPI00137C2945|nr:ChuX/HutX family heme-like substrate-binding protein [Sinimarinibacterium sp. NLF-5-8]QHS10946.1 hemin-degrading factor [Sinimarinibacterium sp. NLF-5-8]
MSSTLSIPANSVPNAAELRAQYAALQQQNVHLRARNAAAQLGVSEGELVAARVGEGVIRLRNDFKELLESMISVGQVMTITRNEYAVNEKRGYYGNLQLKDHGGGAFDSNINLRIFFRHWHHVFAVSEGGAHGARDSVQIFDADGTSVHKIYRTEDGDEAAWRALVERFTAVDQTPGMTPQPVSEPYQPQSPQQVNAAELRKDWLAITDLHQFWQLQVKYRLRRVDALGLAGEDLARPVAADAFRTVMHKVAESGLSIMVFTRSPGVAQIHTGPVHKLVERDGWFNVLDPTFNWHLRMDAVHEAWVVYRPDVTGGQYSLELYHQDGTLISHLFGAVHLQAPELRGWRQLLADLPTLDRERARHVA